MSGLFTRVPLAAVLGLAIGRLACAATIDAQPAGRFAAPEVDAAFAQFSRSSQYDPPLRLALALTRERQHAAPQLSESSQEHAAVQLAAQTHLLRPSTLALAAPEVDAAVPQVSRSSQYDPPLQLALALSGERRRAAPQLSERTQEPAPVQLTAQTRPLRSSALAKLQEPDVKLAQQAGNDEALPPKETETANVDPARTWEIAPGDRTLNTTLAKWSASAGWQLVWGVDVDYPIETRAVLQGTFEEAVASVAQSLAGASVPIQATFYAGNRVLRIVAKGSK